MTEYELIVKIDEIIYKSMRRLSVAPVYYSDTWKAATEIVDTFGTVLGAEKEDSNDKE